MYDLTLIEIDRLQYAAQAEDLTSAGVGQRELDQLANYDEQLRRSSA